MSLQLAANAVCERGPSAFSGHDVYRLFREQGAGRTDIEKIFDAYAGNPPARDNIEAKLALLKELGFGDPVKMIASSPAILGYARDNIEAKLALLKELGFGDPVKMIVTLPAILGLARDNIEAKLALLKELGFDGHALISRWPTITSYAPTRIRFCAAIVKDIPGCSVSHLCELLTRDPAVVAMAASDTQTVDVVTFHARLRERNKRKSENASLLALRKNEPAAMAYFAYRPTEGTARAKAA